MYKLSNNGFNGVQREDGAWVPNEPTNAAWQDYQAWLADGNTPDPADPIAPQPDPAGFMEAVKAALGGVVGANALARAYPLFLPALQQSNWVDLTALIVDAHTHGLLSDQTYAGFGALATQYNIPVTLP